MSVQTAGPQTQPHNTSSIEQRDTVSVVIPCYNEERFIGKALEQLANQFASAHYEIILVDGHSNDRTRDVVHDFRRQHVGLDVSIIDNPARNIPTALNLGIAAARGEIIARMDAHAVPCDGYIQRCVEVLESTDAGAVGMPCIVRPGASTQMAQAIAAAVSHPFGIGDAKYRLGAGGPKQESVDTVAFACFRKALWKELGGFNEALLTNEDYEFNYRIRQSGRQVILDRGGHCDYFARTTLTSLATQYWRYGGWKARMLRLHARSMKLRHLVAPAFVLSLSVLLVLSFFSKLARVFLALELGLYLATSLFFAARISYETKGGLGILFLMPVVFFTIHFSWGSSFLVGLIRKG